MYAVGHLALAYLAGKTASRALKTRIEIPLILALSILPDIDFLLTGVTHRGPTHSIILIAPLLLPLAYYKKKASIPYIAAILQHLAADLLGTGGIQLLWPLSTGFFGLPITQSLDNAAEWTLFLASIAVLTKTGDLKTLITKDSSWLNFALIIPVNSIFSPLFLHIPIRIPTWLYIPHYILLIILTLALLNTIWKKIGEQHKRHHNPSTISKNPQTPP